MTLLERPAPAPAEQTPTDFLNEAEILKLAVGSVLSVTYQEFDFSLELKERIRTKGWTADDFKDLGEPSRSTTSAVSLINPIVSPYHSLQVYKLNQDLTPASLTPRIILPGRRLVRRESQRREVQILGLSQTLLSHYQA